MAKAEKRGNKEAKKPKKIKEAVAAPSGLTKGVSALAPTTGKKK